MPFELMGQDDDSVNMVEHDYEGVEINAVVMPPQLVPCLPHDHAHFIQSDIAADDLTEEHDTILRADGDEIGAGLRIIIGPQSQGAAAWMRVGGH